MTRVKAFMTGRPIAIESDASVIAALDLMVEHGFRHLPVLDADRKVVGVVSFSDLRAALPVPISLVEPLSADTRASLNDQGVMDIMSEAVATASCETPLIEAAQALVDHRISCLPILDAEGRLDGIITETDCLQALVTALWTENRSPDE